MATTTTMEEPSQAKTKRPSAIFIPQTSNAQTHHNQSTSSRSPFLDSIGAIKNTFGFKRKRSKEDARRDRGDSPEVKETTRLKRILRYRPQRHDHVTGPPDAANAGHHDQHSRTSQERPRSRKKSKRTARKVSPNFEHVAAKVTKLVDKLLPPRERSPVSAEASLKDEQVVATANISSIELPTAHVDDGCSSVSSGQSSKSSSTTRRHPMSSSETALSLPDDLTDEITQPTKSLGLQVFKAIPKPKYPIRVNPNEPSLLPKEERARWFKVKPGFFEDESYDFRADLDIPKIRATIEPTLRRLGFLDEEIRIESFNRGGLNRVYLIVCGTQELILRVSLPFDPFYKTESDVATSEFVRHFTDIPVPQIYAFDSSARNEENKIGLEWMLMERAEGASLDQSWLDLGNEKQVEITTQLTKWQHDLTGLQAPFIGGLFLRDNDSSLEFCIGPCVSHTFAIRNRPYYDCDRGPFKSMDDYYAAIVELQRCELEDHAILLLRNPKELLEDEQELFECLEPQKESILREIVHPDDMDRLIRFGSQSHWQWHTGTSVAYLSQRLYDLLDLWEGDRDPPHYLIHEDLSLRNVIMDVNGNISAVIDWEMNGFGPLILKCQDYPTFLEDVGEMDDYSMTQSPSIVPGGATEDMKKIAWDAFWNERNTQVLGTITANLRPVYEQCISRLSSPLETMFHMNETNQQLHDMFTRATRFAHYKKILDMLGEKIGEDD